MAFGGLDGSCGLDGGFAAQKLNISLASAITGLMNIDGGLASIVIVDPGDPTGIEITTGGFGHVIESNDTISTGSVIPHRVRWEPVILPTPSSSNTVNWDPEARVFPIVVDKDGLVQYSWNDNNGAISAGQSTNYFQIGAMQIDNIIDRNVLNVDTFGRTPYSSGADLLALSKGLGAINYPGQVGVQFTPNVGSLNVGLSGGTTAGLLGNFPTSQNSHNESVIPDFASVQVTALFEPDTGVFVFSATNELDPTKVAKNGLITAFADAGNGEVIVSAQGHGMKAGDTVQIENTTNYNGRFVLASVTGNTYNITTTFEANDATGDWSGLTDAANFQFTGQRLSLFTLPFVACAAGYGKREYSTIADYDILNGEVSEGYIEPEQASGALSTQILIIRQDVTDFADTDNYFLRKVTSRLKS